MQPADTISFSEWLKALEEIQKIEPEREGLTMAELCEKLNRGVHWVSLNFLRPLAAQGRITCKRVAAIRIDGGKKHVPVYILKPETGSGASSSKTKS